MTVSGRAAGRKSGAHFSWPTLRPFTGAALLLCAALAGCAGALTLPQAKTFADRNVMNYCRSQNDCGKLLQTKAQRLHGRWLIDYDSNGRMLTVAVDDDGNTRLDIWNKK